MIQFYKFILLFCIALFFSSCGETPVYESTQKLKKDWTYDNPLIYEFEVKDIDSNNDLFLHLTFSTTFGYQNIYVNIETTYPDKTQVKDIVSLNLTDGGGTFLGKCSSSKCTIDILLQENFKFKQKGKHTIKIAQHSREEKLEGIKKATLAYYKRQLNNNKKPTPNE